MLKNLLIISTKYIFIVTTVLALIVAQSGNLVHADQNNEIPADKIKQFVDIFQKIKKQYVDDVDDQTLFDYAIKGMVTGLDPHSTYMSNDEYEELKIGTTGKFGGIGIEITMEDGFVKIVAPIDDTPASRAGLKSGDLVIEVDDVSLRNKSINEAVKLMRGKPGTEVDVTILRKNVNDPIEITITRQIIVTKGIKSEIFFENIGYIRLASFQSNSTNDLEKEVIKLKQQTKNKLVGLVLDLRNNPGGVLGSAVGISDLFLKEGKIVYTKGRTATSDLEYYATPQDILETLPIIVMINGGSASASEIVAGALQDNGRATVVGSKSFGKASVQTIQELYDGSALKLTTAKYYTPKGRDIHKEGINPDIIFETKKDDEKNSDSSILKKPFDKDSELFQAVKLLQKLAASNINFINHLTSKN
ncbi:MAG: peptidase S41 [Gammaproteobacteria bacterium]|nr:peptidase S41 [Gammaproteobacteria bacterium]